ncbi:CHAP domain-containing protein [Acetobacteraceae bacterium KSS8]|uniref:CHAP domain-containing protein n=1 Tax=Endosaccharibacter trunci TaxID=2812733 RepID=A0ABT1W9M1_9PROT|nr:CHAP domain-containing protein [Acetobacteraceae bacterium KSS8]
MQASTIRTLVRASVLTLTTVAGTYGAQARTHHLAHHAGHHARHYAMNHGGGAVIQCVAFAKSNSDIELSGNAANWWQNAEGVYARGSAPEVGSVLNFRANGRMRLGHVAVVTNVVNSRTIQIDQSHWNARGISRDVSVIDVSENNDWTAVRVELGHNGTFGSIYPTYGFIYARPDTGRMVTARSDVIAPKLGAAPSDLRGTVSEVAEAPVLARGVITQGTDLSGAVLSDDAPNRDLR